MKDEVTLQEWNETTLIFMQSLLGAISPNFRMISLGRDSGYWILSFVLAEENEGDQEEIQDVGDEFEALQSRPVHFRTEVVVTQALLSWPSPPVRVVYRRKET